MTHPIAFPPFRRTPSADVSATAGILIHRRTVSLASPTLLVPTILTMSLLVITVGSPRAVHAEPPPAAMSLDPPVDTLRQPLPLEELLRRSDPAELAREVELRGDARRGALLFYKSAAACSQCHAAGDEATPLGPDLARFDDHATAGHPTAEYLIESILDPSRKIRRGYETMSVLTTDGQLLTGLIASADDTAIVLRDANDLLHDTTIARDDIEAVRPLSTSMMPSGLVDVIGGQKQFYDLAKYVIEVARGGPERQAALMPSDDELLVVDDTADLDHAGIIRGLGRRDFTAGEAIYHGYCYSCHGSDGNTPSLPTARAFGTQKLKFGADPYRMFLTLSRGNGLMAPMSQLTPKERYQVAHYIREQFIKPGGLDEIAVDADYLAGLPEGSGSGDRVVSVQRDYGPALASQLGRDVNSALTVDLQGLTLSYDLHSLDVAGAWSGGFLNLDQTQHIRGRGEGTADPAGPLDPWLSYWRWGHEGTLDYPTDSLLPRGPLPTDWLDYHGYYLHGDSVVLSYAVDRREVLESPAMVRAAGDGPAMLAQTLRVGPGPRLVLAVSRLEGLQVVGGDDSVGSPDRAVLATAADEAMRLAVGLLGDRQGLHWSIDGGRLVLEIPAGDESRLIQIVRRPSGPDHQSATGIESATAGEADSATAADDRLIAWVAANDGELVDPATKRAGGSLRWAETPTTVGYPGLESGGYALDTLPVPESTPWETWFRTSAIDFLSDGRMVVTTYGGDVWIVDGVDRDLLELRWKRFAAGLYEPMGVRVVDDQIYVTGKDRLTRLHDLNGDGEADFYESFFADPDVSVNFHAFNFDLQVDSQGNFYYAKSGHGADSDLPGVVYKVSPDGRYFEPYSTGFRTPNGMGMMPGDRVTASDNQGQWMPASKINLLRPGGFYGWVPTYGYQGKWSPGGGKIDVTAVVPPETFDQPMIWMPQVWDNSSGGQLWADDARWGPLAGHLLHTSFGRGWMFYLHTQDVDGETQAAIIKLPFDFRTGIMRAAVNPADGQVYATGLDGWNGGGRAGLLDHGIQRIRYTGRRHRMVSGCRVEPEGLRLSFNFELDAEQGTDLASYHVRHWDYLWQASYGSEMYSPSTGEVGIDAMNVVAAELAEDRKSVLLKVPGLQPVNQVHIVLGLDDAGGERFEEEIYWTINSVPTSP